MLGMATLNLMPLQVSGLNSQSWCVCASHMMQYHDPVTGSNLTWFARASTKLGSWWVGVCGAIVLPFVIVLFSIQHKFRCVNLGVPLFFGCVNFFYGSRLPLTGTWTRWGHNPRVAGAQGGSGHAAVVLGGSGWFLALASVGGERAWDCAAPWFWVMGFWVMGFSLVVFCPQKVGKTCNATRALTKPDIRGHPGQITNLGPPAVPFSFFPGFHPPWATVRPLWARLDQI